MTEVPDCDCGYTPRGRTVEERVEDARDHARAVHGIEVSAEQILRLPDAAR